MKKNTTKARNKNPGSAWPLGVFRKLAKAAARAGRTVSLAACLALMTALLPLEPAVAADLRIYGAGGGGGTETGGGGAAAVIEFDGTVYGGTGGRGAGPGAIDGTEGLGFAGLGFTVTGGAGGDGGLYNRDGQSGETLNVNVDGDMALRNLTIRGGQGGWDENNTGKGGDSGLGYSGGLGGTGFAPWLPGLGGDVSFTAQNLLVSGDIDVVSGASDLSNPGIPAGNVSFSVETLSALGLAPQNFTFYTVQTATPTGMLNHEAKSEVMINTLELGNDVNLGFQNLRSTDHIRVGDLVFLPGGHTLAVTVTSDLTDPAGTNNLKLGGNISVHGPGAVLDMRATPYNWDSRNRELVFGQLHPGMPTALTFVGGGGKLLLEGAKVTLLDHSAHENFAAGEIITLIDSPDIDWGSGLAQTTTRSWAGSTYFGYDLLRDPKGLLVRYTGRVVAANEARSYGQEQTAGTLLVRARGDAVADALITRLPRHAGAFSFSSFSGGHLEGGYNKDISLNSGFLAAGLGWGFEGQGVYSALGAFIDYGFGGWKADNRHSTVLRSPDGDVQSYGGGLVYRMDFDRPAIRLDASVAYGHLKNEYYANSDLLLHANTYDHSTDFWNAHLSGRKLFALTDNHGVELNAAVLYAWQGSDTVRNSFDERLGFDSVNSFRTRLGARFVAGNSSHTDTTIDADRGTDEQIGMLSFFVGGAWEKEYTAKNRFSVEGQRQDYNSGLKGDTGIAEIGLKWTNNKVELELSGNGRYGRTRGYGGMANVSFTF